jgi:hypothetical protein
MAHKFWFGFLICLLLTIGVFFAGCSSDSSDAVATPVPTTAPAAKYSAGDIIAKSDNGGETQLYVIIKYDPAKDEYERAWLYKNDDGTWGHFIDSRTDRSTRTIIEKVYPARVARVSLAAIPVITQTIATPTPVVLSGDAPTVTAISPVGGPKDGSITVTITGTNFQAGAIPKLLLPGDPVVTATGVTVSSTRIDCTFNLYNHATGKYQVTVTNPDGQSGTLRNAFTVGDAAPIVSGAAPSTLAINESAGLVIYGQNFKDGVKVSLIRDSAEIPCVSPASSGGNRISCDLDLNIKRYPMVKAGDWDLRVLNIEGTQSGIWTKKFVITNSTA